MVRFLLQKGADITKKTKREETLLHLCTNTPGREEIFKLCLEHAAKESE